MKSKPNELFLTIATNEEGVIKSTDTRFDGIITHGIQSCIAVVISDKANKTYVLQHHDNFTDPASITSAIAREKMSNPEVVMIRYPHPNSLIAHETEKNFTDITKFLDKKNISYDKELKKCNSRQYEGGVLVRKDGTICLNHFIVNKNMNTSKTPEFVLCEGSKCWDVRKSVDENVILSNASFVAGTDFYMNSFIACNATLFGEQRETFLRYDGQFISKQYQTLPYKMEQYLLKLADEGIKKEDEFIKRIESDREKGLFNAKGDRFHYEKDEKFVLSIYKVFSKISEIARFGCLPPENTDIVFTEEAPKGKTVFLTSAESLAKSANRTKQNLESYKNVPNGCLQQ